MTVMRARSSWEPLRLYSWTVVGGAGAGALGITDNYDHALAVVVDALLIAPVGSRGLVHRVHTSFIRSGYRYEGLVARCRIDPAGDMAWDEIPRPSAWTNLGPLFTDPDEPLGDAIPPEAFTTGLADLAAHRERQAQTNASNSTDRR
jgi:hypothetical protein